MGIFNDLVTVGNQDCGLVSTGVENDNIVSIQTTGKQEIDPCFRVLEGGFLFSRFLYLSRFRGNVTINLRKDKKCSS